MEEIGNSSKKADMTQSDELYININIVYIVCIPDRDPLGSDIIINVDNIPKVHTRSLGRVMSQNWMEFKGFL